MVKDRDWGDVEIDCVDSGDPCNSNVMAYNSGNKNFSGNASRNGTNAFRSPTNNKRLSSAHDLHNRNIINPNLKFNLTLIKNSILSQKKNTTN